MSGARRTFGAMLRRERERAKVTMGHLARELKVSTPYLSGVEKGSRKPLGPERIMTVGRVLGIDPDGLLKAAATERDEIRLPVGESQQAVKVGAALMRGWPSLTDEQLEKMYQILEGAKRDPK